jgi:predicted ATP-grasp superfamily ATP-dependent carboligase
MKILVTGTRAPVALDICRSLDEQGFSVYSADSMHYPLSTYSSSIKQHFALPKPNKFPRQFANSISDIIKTKHIDILLPTCEEVFFLAHFHEQLSKKCRLLFDDIKQLKPLHNKYDFNKLASNFDILAPQSHLLLSNACKKSIRFSEMVLKPVYSRFGDNALIKPSKKQVQQLDIKVPYIAQRFIPGTEYCNYAFAIKGKLLSHCCYRPKYRAGKAGIYFEPVTNRQIVDFSKNLVESLEFTGQISFDFIVNSDGVFVLECNPRATSGFHLLKESINWQTLFNGCKQSSVPSENTKMLGFAMATYGMKHLFKKNSLTFLHDFMQAQDILKGTDTPFLTLRAYKTLGEIYLRMLKDRKNFKNASTDDIEWNGEALL